MIFPTWPPRDWRALLALVASVAGAGVLTVNRIWLIKILERTKQFPVIGNIALMDTFIIGIVLVSLGLAINKRSVKGSILGASFSAEGGDDTSDTTPQASVTTTTISSVKPAGENGNAS